MSTLSGLSNQALERSLRGGVSVIRRLPAPGWRGERRLYRLAGIEYEIVVDPAADDDLRVSPVADDLVQNSPGREIEWRACDGPQLSRGDKSRAHRRVAVRRNGQAVSQRSARRA